MYVAKEMIADRTEEARCRSTHGTIGGTGCQLERASKLITAPRLPHHHTHVVMLWRADS